MSMPANPETDKTLKEKIYAFSKDEIQRFLQQRWKLGICEVCETQNSFEYAGDEELVVILPVSEPDALTTLTNKVIVAFPMLCSSCGNTKLLAAVAIRNWLDDNP